jgi:methyl coenzyme M reductase subunit C
VPGPSLVAPSVLEMDRSAVGTNVSVSVTVLFAAVGSVVPAATAAVAVFAREPVAVDEIVAVSVNVAVPLGSRSTVVLMLPLPEAGQVDPAEATHVHVAPDNVPGNVSVMVVASAADGPAFDATIVYVTVEPGTSVALPSVLVIDTSARRVIVVVSVAVLFAGVGSVEPPGNATDAVFDSVPVAVDATVALTVNVALPAASTLTEAEMLPEPEAGQLEPAKAVQVHVAPVRLAGSVSVRVAPVIADGPAFDATMV